MNFLIIDNTTKELIGLFKSKDDALLHYIKNNVVERLKICRHQFMSNNDIDLFVLRNLENLMEEIFEYEYEKNYFFTKSSYFITRSNLHLDMCEKLRLDYKIERFDDDNLRNIKF